MQGVGGGSSAVEETFLRFLLMLEMTGTFSRCKQERAACFWGRNLLFGWFVAAASRKVAPPDCRG